MTTIDTNRDVDFDRGYWVFLGFDKLFQGVKYSMAYKKSLLRHGTCKLFDISPQTDLEIWCG